MRPPWKGPMLRQRKPSYRLGLTGAGGACAAAYMTSAVRNKAVRPRNRFNRITSRNRAPPESYSTNSFLQSGKRITELHDWNARYRPVVSHRVLCSIGWKLAPEAVWVTTQRRACDSRRQRVAQRRRPRAFSRASPGSRITRIESPQSGRQAQRQVLSPTSWAFLSSDADPELCRSQKRFGTRSGLHAAACCRRLGAESSHRVLRGRPPFSFNRTLLIPASAQRLVQLDNAQQFVQANLRETQLRLEQIAVGVEGVELRIDAALITHIRQPLPILQRGDQRLLFLAALADALVRDQRVRNVCERRLNRFLILDERSFALRLREFYARLQRSRGEDRL